MHTKTLFSNMVSPTSDATVMQSLSATILVFCPNQKVHPSQRRWVVVCWGIQRSTFCFSWVMIPMCIYEPDMMSALGIGKSITHASEPKSQSATTMVFYIARKVHPYHRRWLVYLGGYRSTHFISWLQEDQVWLYSCTTASPSTILLHHAMPLQFSYLILPQF